MPFHVYPDPQTAALSVASGATTYTAVEQLAGTDPSGTYDKMMFMRVSMFGGAGPPTLYVRAGTGSPVEVTTTTAGVYRVRGKDPGEYVADVWLIGSASVHEVRIGFFADTAEDWRLGIRNNDGAGAREFTWVVADSAGETAQPWIHVSPAALSYSAISEAPVDQSTQVCNKGTGPLKLTALGPALPSEFTVQTALPLEIPPSGTASLGIRFTTPSTPPVPDTVLAVVSPTTSPVDSTAGVSDGHNQRLSLTGSIIGSALWWNSRERRVSDDAAIVRVKAAVAEKIKQAGFWNVQISEAEVCGYTAHLVLVVAYFSSNGRDFSEVVMCSGIDVNETKKAVDDVFAIVSGHMAMYTKLRNIERDPRVVLSFLAPRNPSVALNEYAVLHARATVQPSNGAWDLLDRLTKVYMTPDTDFPAPKGPGYIVRYSVERIGGVGPWVTPGAGGRGR